MTVEGWRRSEEVSKFNDFKMKDFHKRTRNQADSKFTASRAVGQWTGTICILCQTL